MKRIQFQRESTLSTRSALLFEVDPIGPLHGPTGSHSPGIVSDWHSKELSDVTQTYQAERQKEVYHLRYLNWTSCQMEEIIN